MRWVLVLCLGLLLAVGCGEDSERTLTPPASPEYLPNDSADNLVANVIMAWEAMDAEGYAALLYDGVQLATDGQAYAPFTFYYDRSLDPGLPEYDLYEREVQRTQAMFGGLPGLGVPGIKSISMDLTPYSAWHGIIGGEVEGDLGPEDVLWCLEYTYFHFTLLSTIGGSDVYNWLVEDGAILHCIPVQVGEAIEWRLWKWRDVVDLRTEEASLSQIKALY